MTAISDGSSSMTARNSIVFTPLLYQNTRGDNLCATGDRFAVSGGPDPPQRQPVNLAGNKVGFCCGEKRMTSFSSLLNNYNFLRHILVS